MVFPDDESVSDWYATRADRYRLAVAADFSAAYPLIMRRDGELIEAQDDTPVALLRKGTGRHRRPVTPNG
ncbi:MULTISPECIES: hypothetical protein [Streptomyces]|uniref:hypothetical protein n=1 Tax=Streptomyces TaxID=1883 RepID=UPI0004AB35AA|nr:MULTISPECIES: hypothetical protein [Streptomyces]